jgi:hypothetical protein
MNQFTIGLKKSLFNKYLYFQAKFAVTCLLKNDSYFLLKNKYFIAAAATNKCTAIARTIIIVPSLENIMFIIGYIFFSVKLKLNHHTIPIKMLCI